MPIDPDAYAIWGDWDLQQFRVQIIRWRDTRHPPDDVFARANQWWPRLRQRSEWSNAPLLISGEPKGIMRWMWVPGGDWLDEQVGYFRTQCFFRVYEQETPPRLVCEEFHTVRAMTPTEVDRADGLGSGPAAAID